MSIPAAPTEVLATAGYGCTTGKGMAIVDWTPDANSPATSYIATSSPGGHTVTVVSPFPDSGVQPRSQAIFFDLDLLTPYTFTVTATNGDGTSSASLASEAVIPTLLAGMMPNIFTALIAQVAKDYRDYLVGPPPEMHFGEEYANNNTIGPRIVFIPHRATWRGSQHRGTGTTNVMVGPISFPQARQVAERTVNFEARIWSYQGETDDAQQDSAANYGQTERLMGNLVASMWGLFPGSFGDLSENWLDENGRNLAQGAAVQLSGHIKIPVPAYMPPLATLSRLPQQMHVLPAT